MTAPTNEIAAGAKMDRQPIIGSPDILDRIKGAKQRLQDGHALMRVPVDPTDPDCVLADVELEIERLRELLSVSKLAATQGDDGVAGREVLQPLEEPVSISKALLAGRLATVGGNEKTTTAFLVNIQLAPWGASKDWVEGFVDGFNRAAKWMQSAMTEFRAAPVEEPTTNALNALRRARDGWHEEAVSLAKRLKYAEADNDLLRKHQSKDVWYFQGDGEDHIESMGNNMAVVIHAHDLRSVISATPVQSGEPVGTFKPVGRCECAFSQDECEVCEANRDAYQEHLAEQPAVERAAFEAWARTKNMDLTPFDTTFDSDFTSNAWDGWQARAASPQAMATQPPQSFEQWASDPVRADKIPLEKHPNGAYSDSRSYLIYYGWKSALKYGVAQPAQTERPATDDPIALLLEKHAEVLEGNDYAYFELAYTRHTEWMAWICSNSRDDDPNRKVIARGQGGTPQSACEAALAAAAQPVSGVDHG